MSADTSNTTTPNGANAGNCSRPGQVSGVDQQTSPQQTGHEALQPFGPDYETLGVIGHGGMGTVWKVLNLRVGKRVEALKEITHGRFGLMAVNEDQFRIEMKATARLKHPGVVTLYDTGTAQDGETPFFTMEYAEKGDLLGLIQRRFPHGSATGGTTLTQRRSSPAIQSDQPTSGIPAPGSCFIANRESILVARGPETDQPSKPPQQTQIPQEPQNISLPDVNSATWYREIAALLVRVAEAVEFMHLRGVSHRDLKPSNILLVDEGQNEEFPHGTPKVADFGLALLLNEHRQGGQDSVGTPSYMPPEQTMSSESLSPDDYRVGDVYSLGAILYEALTGRPPFEGETPADTLKAVREQPLIAPRTINPQVPAPLERICLRCLRRDRKKRYPSSAVLARDLKRFLRPVRRIVLTWAGVAALVLFGLLGGLVWDRWHTIDTLKKSAQANEQAAERETGDEALQSLNTAHDNYVTLTKNAIFGRNRALFKVAEVTLKIAVRYRLGRDTTQAKQRCKRTREILKELRKIDPDFQPHECQRLAALSYHWEGVALLDEKNHRAALAILQKAHILWEQLASATGPDATITRALARSHGYLGDVWLELGKPRQAWDEYNESLRVRKRLCQGDGVLSEDWYQLARGEQNFGYLYDWDGQPLKAIQEYEKSLTTLRACPEPPAEFRYDLAGCLISLVELELNCAIPKVPDKKKTLDRLNEVAADFSRTEDKERVRGDRARVFLLRGLYSFRTKQQDAARKDFHRAIEEYRSLARKNKDRASDYYNLARAHALLARLSSNQPEEQTFHRVAALIRLQEAVDRGYRHFARLHRDWAFDEALRRQQRFVQVVRQLQPARNP